MIVSGFIVMGIMAMSANAAFAQTYGPSMMSPGRISIHTASDLSIGSTGPAVVELQSLLSEMGYLIVPRGVVFGYFGPLTRAALVQYQLSQEIQATGTLNASTKVALYNQFLSQGWIDTAGVFALSGNTSSSNTSSNTNTPSSNNTVASTNSTVMAPGGSTGYWFDGNWYNSLPWIGTTTISSNITEYWYNGTRYTISQIPDPLRPSDMSTVAINNTSTGKGYWYNGVWTAIDPDNIRGGYYSPNPGFAIGGANFQQGGNGYFQTFTYTPSVNDDDTTQ